MSLPRITIITPSYNQGHYLEQTILSVLDQGYPNLEYIIIDGGSKDQSFDIIKKYEKHLAYWVSEKDRGQAHAINKGLCKATGQVFNWINSDDFLEPNSLKVIGETFAQNPDATMVCGYTYCFFDDNKEHSHTYRMGLRKTIADTILNVEMNQPGSFYRMDVVKGLGGVNESLRYVFDDELWFRFLLKYGTQGIRMVEQRLANFRLHGSSKSVGEGFEEFYKELLNVHLFIAQQMDLPDHILKYLVQDQLIERYQSDKWDINIAEKTNFHNHFAHQYRFKLYKDHFYNDARRGVQNLSPGKKRKQDFILSLKLMMPDAMIEAIRKIKNQK